MVPLQTYRTVVSLAPVFRSDAEHHAKREAPREACGLVYIGSDREQHYLPCRNLCENPEDHFILDPSDYYRASLKGKIVAVIHSHPQGTEASEADRKACKQSKLPWFIYQLPQERWLTINP